MKKKFAEFVASGKPAKKFIEEAQTSGDLSGAFGNGGTVIDKEGTGASVVDENDNLPIPSSGDISDQSPLDEEADTLGAPGTAAPAPGTPEPGKDLPLK